MRKPNFFIVGKPKSGTTALHQMLGEHPQIFMSDFKEPHHFHREHIQARKDRNRGYHRNQYQDRTVYLNLFADALSDHLILGESSTGYLYSKTAARDISNFNPEAKILMCFREPVRFLHSFHYQLLRSTNESEPDFQKALKLEESRRKGLNVPSTASYPENLLYSEHVKYRAQAERFFEHFPRSQIKVVLYEDFKDDNAAVFRDLLQFLGVDTTFVPNFQQVHPTKTLRMPRLSRWISYYGDKGPYALSRWVPSTIVDPLRPVVGALLKQNKSIPKLDVDVEKQLRQRFRSDVESLSDLLGIDLCEKWGYVTEP